jgi:hypothetical protein
VNGIVDHIVKATVRVIDTAVDLFLHILRRLGIRQVPATKRQEKKDRNKEGNSD